MPHRICTFLLWRLLLFFFPSFSMYISRELRLLLLKFFPLLSFAFFFFLAYSHRFRVFSKHKKQKRAHTPVSNDGCVSYEQVRLEKHALRVQEVLC